MRYLRKAWTNRETQGRNAISTESLHLQRMQQIDRERGIDGRLHLQRMQQIDKEGGIHGKPAPAVQWIVLGDCSERGFYISKSSDVDITSCL